MATNTLNTLNGAPRLIARQIARTANPRPTGAPASDPVVDVHESVAATPGDLRETLPQTSAANAGPAEGAGIVCGTDFSIHAREAADVAATLAWKSGASLTLAHVLEPARGDATAKSLNAMLRYKSRNKLKLEAERLRASGTTVDETLPSGSPPRELVRVATAHQAGLIVVSSLGHIEPARWLIGSVAEQTAQLSPVPVLVVRDSKPFRAWKSGRKSLNILVGHDFSASADAALAWVAALRSMGRCRITVAHLPTTQVATGWVEVGSKASSKKRLVDIRELLREDLIQRCRGLLGKSRFQVEVISVRDSVAPRLVKLGRALGADLIVVGTSQKGTLRRLCLGSVSRGVLRDAMASVVCVPATTKPLKAH